jgi:hypothetical protein
MDLGCLYWLLTFSCTRHCLSGSVERQQQTPFTRIFEEQLLKKRASKNRVDETKLYAFCNNFCTVKIV